MKSNGKVILLCHSSAFVKLWILPTHHQLTFSEQPWQIVMLSFSFKEASLVLECIISERLLKAMFFCILMKTVCFLKKRLLTVAFAAK
jgi:hypothetical protein